MLSQCSVCVGIFFFLFQIARYCFGSTNFGPSKLLPMPNFVSAPVINFIVKLDHSEKTIVFVFHCNALVPNFILKPHPTLSSPYMKEIRGTTQCFSQTQEALAAKCFDVSVRLVPHGFSSDWTGTTYSVCFHIIFLVFTSEYDDYIQIFENSNILVTNMYSDIRSYQHLFVSE